MKKYDIQFLEEVITHDGRWVGTFRIGMQDVQAKLQESAVEFTLRQQHGSQKGKSKPSQDQLPIAEDEKELYRQALAQKHAVYVVEGEEFHVERLDRRSGGLSHWNKRQLLKDEAMTAVGYWQDRKILGSAIPRVAPEQRSNIDDFLDRLIKAKDLR